MLIFFIVTDVVYNVSINSKHLISLIASNKEFNLYSTIPLIQKNDRKNLYESLIEFNITNDDIIHTLKQYSIETKTKEFNEFNLTFKKVTAFDKYHSNSVIEIEK